MILTRFIFFVISVGVQMMEAWAKPFYTSSLQAEEDEQNYIAMASQEEIAAWEAIISQNQFCLGLIWATMLNWTIDVISWVSADLLQKLGCEHILIHCSLSLSLSSKSLSMVRKRNQIIYLERECWRNCTQQFFI